ncbi:hypothetical protein B7463_g10202, partial [Scytalidium lignicola]
MESGLTDWVELSQLMQQRYPDLPVHEAYVNLLHDSFVKLPKEVAQIVKPVLPHLVHRAPELAQGLGVARGSPWGVFSGLLAGFIRDAVISSMNSEAGNTTANTGEILDLVTKLNPEIFERALLAAIAGSDKDSRETETVAESAKFVAENMKKIASSADHVVRQVHGIHVIGNSLVDHINYYGRWMQTVSTVQIAQGYQAIQVLTDIKEHLGESNSITVSGSGGPDGFARHVYDLIKEAIDEIVAAERNNHRFFVYHPDTNWYPAFHRLIKQDPLPPTFCAKSDNLDTFCRYMQEVRTQLNRELERGKDIIFHLLIPTWYRISIKEPLHFPDYLQPFRVEGRKHKGKPLVEFNLPAAPAMLLHGVANALDPKSSNTIALGVSTTITLPTVGWGINGACAATGLCLGAATGLGVLVALPVWIGTAIPAMSTAAPVIGNAIYDALCEEAPRILGSNQRLNTERRSGMFA